MARPELKKSTDASFLSVSSAVSSRWDGHTVLSMTETIFPKADG